MEDFGMELVSHFIGTNPYAEAAGVHIRATPWKPIVSDGAQFPTAFTHAEDKKDTVTITTTRSGKLTITAGFEELWLLKTAKSAFTGYLKDRLTTLRETQDRLFGTLAKAEWQYNGVDYDFNTLRRRTEAALVSAFSEHDSLSVQQTLYAMAEAALNSVHEVTEVSLSMPNKHCNLVDLSAFGQDNPNQIFIPTDEPHGSISARIRRDA
jgi:urate oxidase